MHISYDDITRRIAEPPLWWLDGVPRYEPFRPGDTNVYAGEALLVHIRCQACRADFHIGLFGSGDVRGVTYQQRLHQGRTLGVGDPPNAGCCHTGACMNADEVAVLEFWTRRRDEWVRLPGLERGLWVSDEELRERHREAWRRLRSYAARPENFTPRWYSEHLPPDVPPFLPSPVIERTPETGKFINEPELNAARRRALLALSGRISEDEYAALARVKQTEYYRYEARPEAPRPAWAEPLAGEVRRIDEIVLANAIPGYATMTQDERDERYCHGLDRRLYDLSRTGRMGPEEQADLWQLLIHNRYSR